ncbi:MAG: hypothetical protein WC789_11295 [Lentisphaeria bacterium]|jgi:hypothetical protein
MPPASPTIHIVEPTLRDQTGHCHSFILSLLAAVAGGTPRLELWAARGAAAGLFPEAPGLRLHPLFTPLLRRLQTFLLFRRLLRAPGRLFVATATRTELLLLDWAARGPIPPGKAFLYVHWLKLTPGKRRSLARLARRQPGLQLLAPTAGVRDALAACGFRNAQVVPYPITPAAPAPALEPAAAPFRHLLFAGAARLDKGFARVVDLVAFLQRLGEAVPVLIQASPPHTGRHEPGVVAELARLAAIGYPHLVQLGQTLDAEEYRALFRGAISLQPYDPAAFAGERVSGVTLDSLTQGSPVIVPAGTWMARLAERFNAGVALADFAPETLWAAACRIRADYAAYRQRALAGGATLQRENSAAHLLALLTAAAPGAEEG